MAVINAVITRCNSLFKNEESFIVDERLYKLSFNEIKAVDLVFCDHTPMYIENNPERKEDDYFSQFDLSKGLNHYEVALTFSTLEEAKNAFEQGLLFELFKGVTLQFVLINEKDDYTYIEPKILIK